MSDYQIFDSFFNYQIKWMYAGIETTMKKESLHTCALALSTYTEIMGGLVTGNLKEKNQSHNNYDAFLPYLGQKYVELDELVKTKYKEELQNLYNAVRSKLIHEFSLRESYGMWLSEKSDQNRIGLELITNKTEISLAIHINFHIREYYRDFKNGVIKYYTELKNYKVNQSLFGNFLKATVQNFQSS